ncbi:hypothetical protein M0R45_007785 [Rubus argutus]|uniref:Uncharacterized protein n=1 Tax=Rubus argutus TaxID=59490 RepID=A0AAW1Y074_RUBAR
MNLSRTSLAKKKPTAKKIAMRKCEESGETLWLQNDSICVLEPQFDRKASIREPDQTSSRAVSTSIHRNQKRQYGNRRRVSSIFLSQGSAFALIRSKSMRESVGICWLQNVREKWKRG